MYIMYVDEAGDTGMSAASTTHFGLTGLVIHELRWKDYLDHLIAFRRRMKQLYGLLMTEEIHAGKWLHKPGTVARIAKHNRLAILRAFVNELALMTDFSVVSVLVSKAGKANTYDVFENAWKTLVQRLENTTRARNFHGPSNADERSTIYPDNTDVKKLTMLIRRLRRNNPIPNQPQYGVGFRNMPLLQVIEDPNFRESDQSYFIQAVDTIAFFLYQREVPCKYIKAKGATKHYERLNPILCKVVSSSDPLWGVVRL